MKNTVFVHTNDKQIIGAHIAKHAIKSRLKDPDSVDVKFINVDELEVFKGFVGTDYIFANDEHRTYSDTDLQSFTLSRFMPPELMGYQGKAIVIDPDIFVLRDINELFELDLNGAAVAACKKKDAWDTSVMLMDCGRLTHWKIADILAKLKNHEISYTDVMTLNKETAPIKELSRLWNHLDEYTPETKMIHMTGRMTQPWRTGLPIDFTRNKMPKLLGIIPREPIHKLLGKYQTHYQPHPNKEIENLFLDFARAALEDGAITKELVQGEIAKGHVRKDLLECI